jgi:drug/metabolite transporter (DMT)-like permease
MDRRKTIAYIEVTLTVIFWGVSFIATKVALRDVSPPTVVWLRFAMGLVIMGIAVLMRRQFTQPDRKDLSYLALLGFLGITLHQWLQSTALVTSQASTTAWIIATGPIFMALLGWIILRERLRGMQVLGIGIATTGVLLVVTRGDLASLFAGNFGAPGDVLILISSLNWSIFSALSRRGLRKYPATQMMFFVMGFGWLFSSLIFFTGPGLGEIGQLTWSGWMGVIFLGVFCSGLAYIFWYDALQVLPVAQAGAFIYLEPFVTVIVAAIVLGEIILLSSLLGGAAILVGVWLVQRYGSG